MSLLMKIPAPRVLLYLLPALAISIACVDDGSHETIGTQGTVVFIPLEGGFHGIVADDGTHWDPDNLPEEFAVDSVRVTFRGVTTDHPTFHQWGRTLQITQMKRIADPPSINLEPFRALARNSDCADKMNRLFLIDKQLVFWERESSCADASYARVLYGRTVEHLICDTRDSIAGPRGTCRDPGPYTGMFDTILNNLDKPDLGLGAGHTVTPVSF